MKEFTKNQSKILKGIAIIFMVCLHLYNRSDFIGGGYYKPYIYIKGYPLIYVLSFICDACVPIYCFCAGYAAYIQKDKDIKDVLKRLLKLLKTYWIIVLLTCILGFIFHNDNIPGNIFDFLGNIFLYDINYVGAWWFIQTYMLLVLTAPLLIKVMDRMKTQFILVFILIFYFIAYYFRMMHVIDTGYHFFNLLINMIVLYGTSLFPFYIGLLFKRNNVISFIRNTINRYSQIIGISIIVLSIVAHAVVKSMIVAPFIAIIFIVGYSLLNIKGIMEKILLFFGNHSTVIWLVHMQFYMIFFKDIVFCTNTVIGCFVILMCMCILTSYLVRGIESLL